MTYASKVSSLVNRIGQTVIIRRVSAQGTLNTTTLQVENTTTDTTVKASVRNYKPSQIGGLIQQGDRMVHIAATDLSNEPTPYDKIIIAGKQFNIISVNVRKPQDIVAIYICQVRG